MAVGVPDRASLARLALWTALACAAKPAHAQPPFDAGVPADAATAPSSDAAAPDAAPVTSDPRDGGTPPDSDAARPPTLVPPQLESAPEISLPEDTPDLPTPAEVLLRLTLDATGSVTEATIETPLRDDIDAQVLEAARAMRFSPATRDGVAVPASIRFRFSVQPQPPASPERAPDPRDPEPTKASTPDTPSAPAPDAPPAEEGEGFEARAVVDQPEPGAATRLVLKGEELTTVPGTFGEPLRIVASLPGVVRTPFGIGYFFVRGASFENSGFFVDGFPVPILYHLAAGPAVISSRLVRKLDFYPGGYPTRYGRFSAGVIALETGPPKVEGLHLEGEIDFLRASALAVVPFANKRGTVTAAFRRSYYELLLPLVVDDVTLSYADWQLRVDYDLSRDLSASVFWFGSGDNLDTTQAAGSGVGDDSTRTELGYDFQRVIAKLALRLPDRGRLTWSGTIGVDNTLIRRTEPGASDLRADITGTFLGQRLELVLPVGETWRTQTGVDINTTLYDAQTTFPTPQGLGAFPKPSFDPQTSDLQVQPIVASATPYLEQTLRLDPWEITAGLRLEYLRYARVSTVQFDPRSTLRYELVKDLKLKAATGLFTQPPQPFQIDPEFGNPRLDPTRSWQSSAGMEWKLPYALEIESQLFYSRMFGLPRTTNDFIEEDDGTVRRQVYADDGEGRSYGWEFLFRRRVQDGLYGWLSYTLSWSERFTDDGDTVPFFFDQRHTLNFALSYSVGRWRFGARLTLASGRPDRPILGAEYDADGDRYIALRGGLTSRLPLFHQLDVRIDREFTWGPLEGSVYLDVLNVYNATNSEGRLYQFDFQKSARLPGLPILGTLGLRLVYE